MSKLILSAILVLAFATQAQAYEKDTHLRMTYELLRTMGVKDEVAKYLAITDQWVDESKATSAMLLTSQRQLNHFMGDYESMDTQAHGVRYWFENMMTMATRNHPMAHAMIWLGMKTGNLQLVGVGMHHLQDAYGHVGFNAKTGHAEFGHGTDDPSREPAKYKDYIRSHIQSLVRIVELMPEEWRDRDSAIRFLNDPVTERVIGRKLTAADLTSPSLISEALMSKPDFVELYRISVYNTRQYKELALRHMYGSFMEKGAINKDLDFKSLIPDELLDDPRMEVDDVLTAAIVTGMNGEFLHSKDGRLLFNVEVLLRGTTETEFRNRVASDVVAYSQRLQVFKARQDTLAMMGQKLDENPKSVALRQKYLAYKADIESEFGELSFGLMPGDDLDTILSSPENIMKRARQMAEYHGASDLAFNLTKDIIPHKQSEYYKTNWELNTPNRAFFTLFKDEMHRNFEYKHFGVNWIFDHSGKNPFENLEQRQGSHLFAMELGLSPHEEWEKLAQDDSFLISVVKDANKQLELQTGSDRSEAVALTYDFSNKISFVFQAMKRLASVGIFGFTNLVQKLINDAKANARAYQSQPLDEFRDRKAKGEVQDLTSNPKANNLVEKFRIQSLQCKQVLVK